MVNNKLNNKSNKNKILKYLIFSFIVILLLISLIFFYNYIYSFSKLSVISACYPEQFEEEYGDKACVAGQTSVKYNKTTQNYTINVTYFIEPDIPIIKHEECHIRQFEQKRSFGCDNIVLMTINEIECYSIQRFWEIFY